MFRTALKRSAQPSRPCRTRRSNKKCQPTISHRTLGCDWLEERCLLSVAPLNIALISDAVAQAEQIRQAAAKDTLAIVYDAESITTSGLVNLVKSASAVRGLRWTPIVGQQLGLIKVRPARPIPRVSRGRCR